MIQYHHEQVPIRLPGGVVYRVDFLVVENDGRIRYVDTKGHETEAFSRDRIAALVKAGSDYEVEHDLWDKVARGGE